MPDGRNLELYQACVEAGCTEPQLQAMRLRLCGRTVEQIGSDLGITHQAVSDRLGGARDKLKAHAAQIAVKHRRENTTPKSYGGFKSQLDWYGFLWRSMCGDIEERGVKHAWRRPTIHKTAPPPKLTDEKGNPSLPSVHAFLPEDMLDANEPQPVVCR